MAQAKHWVVTGASRGIGRELVQQLLTTDEQVTAIARNADRAVQLQALQRQYPARLRILEGDVTKDFDLDRAVKALDQQAVDVLINNAGVLRADEGGINEINLQEVEQTFLVNALAPIRVTKAFLPLLKKSEHPVIANISSELGSIADNKSGGYYSYRMSKAALNMFTKSLAVDFPTAIVLSLHPGWVKTDMGGSNASVEPSESVKGLLKVIRGASGSESGRFYDFRGRSLEW